MTTKLPGRPRPQAEALADYHRKREELIRNSADPHRSAVLIDFIIGPPELQHRWRIQLDCGHIYEVYTGGKDSLPSESLRSSTYLPDEYPCAEEGCIRHVTRDIVSWDERMELVSPPDPVDPRTTGTASRTCGL